MSTARRFAGTSERACGGKRGGEPSIRRRAQSDCAGARARARVWAVIFTRARRAAGPRGAQTPPVPPRLASHVTHGRRRNRAAVLGRACAHARDRATCRARRQMGKALMAELPIFQVHAPPSRAGARSKNRSAGARAEDGSPPRYPPHTRSLVPAKRRAVLISARRAERAHPRPRRRAARPKLADGVPPSRVNSGKGVAVRIYRGSGRGGVVGEGGAPVVGLCVRAAPQASISGLAAPLESRVRAFRAGRRPSRLGFATPSFLQRPAAAPGSPHFGAPRPSDPANPAGRRPSSALTCPPPPLDCPRSAARLAPCPLSSMAGSPPRPPLRRSPDPPFQRAHYAERDIPLPPSLGSWLQCLWCV